jgi:hypothetical protein
VLSSLRLQATTFSSTSIPQHPTVIEKSYSCPSYSQDASYCRYLRSCDCSPPACVRVDCVGKLEIPMWRQLLSSGWRWQYSLPADQYSGRSEKTFIPDSHRWPWLRRLHIFRPSLHPTSKKSSCLYSLELRFQEHNKSSYSTMLIKNL